MSIKITINLAHYYDRHYTTECSKGRYITPQQYQKLVEQQRADYLASLVEEERKLITGLFETADAQIASVEDYLAKLKMMRQGYEQQYLPAPDQTAPPKRPAKFAVKEDNG